MKKILIILISSFLFSGCSIQNLFVKKPAGLSISTSPRATVFINGENQGETPYNNQNVRPGEYTVRLVPDSPDGTLQPWESNLRLDPEVTTIINRTFAANDTESASYTLQLKPDPDKSRSFISVVSDPDTSNVSIDANPKGFTPLSKIALDAGGHTVEVSSPGFKPISITVNTIEGYNLVINAKLAREIIVLEEQESSPSATLEIEGEIIEEEGEETQESEEEIERPYVVIQETGTGWLRVRSEPNTTTAQELGRVNVGETLKFIESNDTGWYQIIFEGEEGWISGAYATLYE